MDVVAIIVEASEQATDLGAAAAQACSASMHEARCAVSSGPPADAPSVRAAVTFDADGSVRIVVQRGSNSERRALRFRVEDSAVERWRSVGLVVGTLAQGLLERPSAPPAPTSPPPRPTPPPPPAIPLPAPPPVWVDLGALASPALDDGSWKGGPSLRVGYAIAGLPLATIASFRYALRGGDEAGLEVHWLSGGVGLGGQWSFLADRLWVHVRAELVGQLALAKVDEPFTGRVDEASRWVGGGRFGVDAAWMLARNVGFWLGFDATALQSGTVVTIRADRPGRAPPYELSPQLGLRLAFP